MPQYYVNIDIETASQALREKIAHLDIETASEELQETILNARNAIIFSTESWVADDYEGDTFITNQVTGEVINKEVPKFSELFPGWELPKAMTVKSHSIETEGNMSTTRAAQAVVHWGEANNPIYIVKASGTSGTSPFVTFVSLAYAPPNVMESSISACATLLTTIDSCNIGISKNGNVFRYEMNLSVLQRLTVNNLKIGSYGVHVSTSSGSGWGKMQVTESWTL